MVLRVYWAPHYHDQLGDLILCGFAGFISFSQSGCSRELLAKMGDTLQRRGPDEETFYQDERLSLVFRRLSIVDLEGGSQPIWNEDRSILVVVNGEIYNHRELHAKLRSDHHFRSRSDSEIVLHLYEEYGVQALELLNGMYAIVLWDLRSQSLLLARDRLGIKPLYYAELEQGLLFGSELKALLMHPDCPRRLDWGDLSGGTVQQKDPVSTYVQGITHLPGGYYAWYRSSSSLVPARYWDISDHFGTSTATPAEIEHSYRTLLEDSVHKQLMADVPVGLFLSGGVDSSTLAAILARASRDVHCFTVVERTTYRSGDVTQARKIARSLGLPFYPIYFDAEALANDFTLEDFENLICLIESPRFDPEWLFKSELHRAARKLVPDLKVILLGQGADEFCGGYSKYLGSRYADWPDYLENLRQSMRNTLAEHHAIPARFSAQINTDALYDDRLDIYHRKMKLLTYQLQHFNLWHEDRTSSYHSIESRVPFLDHRLVELAASVPEKYQQELFWNKRIVRNATQAYLPDYPRHHPKVPFFVTDDIASIDHFAIRLCERIYPDFARKYLTSNKALFREDSLQELFTSIAETPRNAWALLEEMAILVFQRYIQEPEPYLRQYRNAQKTPRPLVQEDQWEELEKRFQQPPRRQPDWTLHSRVNIPRHCQILNPLSESEGSTALVLVCQERVKQRIEIPDEHDWIVMLLDAMGTNIDDPKDIQYWSEKTQVAPGELVGVMNNLLNSGFIVRES